MSRLQQIKNEVATKHHYGYWVDLVAQNDLFTIDKYFTEVLKLYAKECSQASLEKAYFNHEIFTRNGHDEEIIELNKESIINSENIVIL